MDGKKAQNEITMAEGAMSTFLGMFELLYSTLSAGSIV